VLTFHAWGSCQRFKASGAITLAGKPSFDHHRIRSNNLKPPGFQLYMLVISVKQGINTMLVIIFFFGVGFVAHEHMQNKFFIGIRNPLMSKLVNHNRKIMFNKENKECVL
jgi:hypothetical protein